MESIWPRVLIVDDNPQQARLASLFVQSLWPTAEVQTVYDGESALKWASTLQPHLIITDVKMAKMDGIEICRRIKLNPYFSRVTKVVAMSGLPSPASQKDVLQFGADAYLAKPIEPDTWRKSLKRLLPTPDQPGG